MIAIVSLILLFFVLVVGRRVTEPLRYDVRGNPRRHPRLQTPQEADDLARTLCAQMTRNEKLNQLSGDTSLPRFMLQYVYGMLSKHGIPHVYSGRNDRLGIPPFCFADGPRGVNLGTGNTAFPVTMARGASFNIDLERQIGAAMARELRAVGANYSGAVCVNLLRHPGWGRAQETYGEDPHHLGAMGVALVDGLQAHNVMACVKHFALNSIENSRFYVDVDIDERTLREVYLPHFRQIVQTGNVASVMSAYNRFRGEHCGHSHHLLTQILRNEWGFKGFVTSDWIHGVRDGVAGFQAGMDVEMPAQFRYGRSLRQALAQGTIREEAVDASVQRVLRTRLLAALKPDVQPYPPDLIACDEHIALAQRAAEEGMVLVKNSGTLPLKPTMTIAVIGRLATLTQTGDHGSSHVRAPHVVTPLQGIRQRVAEAGGTVLYCDGLDHDKALEISRKADAVVLVMGFTNVDEGEYFVVNPNRRGKAWRPSFFGGGGDRTDIGLRAEDVARIKAIGATNPNTTVVYIGGSAISLPWRGSVSAIVFAFYCGMAGGTALGRILMGDANPSGKLPFTIPEDPADLPEFDPFADTVNYRGYHGYLHFDTHNLPVAAPFGHGLSYTTFHYSDLTIAERELFPDGSLTVQVTLTNTGEVAGAEVVQLYIGTALSDVPHPTKRLRGFCKTHLLAGASTAVTLTIPVADLAWYDADARTWRVEKTTYTVLVGGSSDPEKLLRDSIVVRGVNPG